MKLIGVVDVTAQVCGFTWLCEMKTQRHLKNEFRLSWLQGRSVSLENLQDWSINTQHSGLTLQDSTFRTDCFPLAQGSFIIVLQFAPRKYMSIWSKHPDWASKEMMQRNYLIQEEPQFSGFPSNQVLHRLCTHGKLSDRGQQEKQKVNC